MHNQNTDGQSFAVRPFSWGAALQQSRVEPGRTYYEGFSLNNQEYRVGDCVLLYPENDGDHYIGRINAAFCANDAAAGASDPHCIEVTWFERRTNLEPDFKGCADKEREVVELEETDVNPIGCISGKCTLLRALKYEDAQKMAKHVKGAWFFCRGIFKQHINSFVLYRELALEEQAEQKKSGKRAAQQPPAPEHVADSEEVLAATTSNKRAKAADSEPWARAADAVELESSEDATAQRKPKATGRVCVECGATSTPQWREGPQGPKTLCNACGVRYVRAQQRANKRAVSTHASRPSQGQGAKKQAAASAARPKAAKPDAAAASSRARSSSSPEEPNARPLRQAALAAANKTAAFARTGVFPTDDDAPQQQPHYRQPAQQQQQQAAAPAQQQQPRQPLSNDDSNHSSAEEVAFESTGDKFMLMTSDISCQHQHHQQQAGAAALPAGLMAMHGAGDSPVAPMPCSYGGHDDDDEALRSIASMNDVDLDQMDQRLPQFCAELPQQHHDSFFDSFEALSSADAALPGCHKGGKGGAGDCLADFYPQMDCDAASLIHGGNGLLDMGMGNAGSLLVDGELVTVHT